MRNQTLIVLTLMLVIFAAATTPAQSALEPLDAGPRGPFIAAFEWSVARRGDFLWPFESMRPAKYGSVRMVVSTMPCVVVDGKKGKRTEPLTASGHLRINGRLQKPVRPVRPENKQTEQQEFLVRLDQGRLRLTLIVPPGTTLDPEHAFIRIKLYEATKPAPTLNWRHKAANEVSGSGWEPRSWSVFSVLT